MNRTLVSLCVLVLIGLLAGCSDDDLSPTGTDDPTPVVETIDNGDGSFTTIVDAGYLDATEWVHFSFATGDEIEREGETWDVAFKFANIIINGGANGDAGVCLSAFDDIGFDALTDAPEAVYLTDGGEDDPGQAFNDGDGWYEYDYVTHAFSVRVDRYYVIRLSDGSYVKLEMQGFTDDAGTPGFPSFTWIPVTGDFSVSTAQMAGTDTNKTCVAAGTMGSGLWVYLDLDTGLQTIPVDAADDPVWDLGFSFADILVNGGVSGTADVQAIAFDDEGYDALTQAPAIGYGTDEAEAPIFKTGDGWYTYDYVTHAFTVNANRYYVLKVGADYFKLRMTGFTNAAGDSGYPSFEWESIAAP